MNVIKTERNINPPVEGEKQNKIFTFITTVDKKYVTIHVNNMGNFPIKSIDIKISIFIQYYWTKNEILSMSIKDKRDEMMINAFKTNITHITKR